MANITRYSLGHILGWQGLLLVLWTSSIAMAQTGSNLGVGLSAAATASGGVTVALRSGPLDAVQGNPAGLVGVSRRTLDVSGVALAAQGRFRNSVDSTGRASNLAGAMLFGSFAAPVGSTAWRAAFSFTPEMLLRVRWTYADPVGTAGVTYGRQKNQSEIVGLRSSAALARSFGSHWSGGASIGLVYNANRLQAPYIFQVQPALAGLKVLLDLKTHGVGWNGSAGMQWQPNERFRAGASWKSSTAVSSHGTANGDASALFTALGVAAPSQYSYRATVNTTLPQSAAAGFSWTMPRHVIFRAEGDWTGWSTAFRRLPVHLTGGTNAVIDSVVGGTAINDEVPLHWHDQGAFHVGLDSPISEAIHLRGGYSFMSDPVPSATLTPLTAAILRHTLSAGAGRATGRWSWDAAYAIQLPSTQTVRQSSLQAGEYSNSQVRVLTQSLTVSSRLSF